MANNVDLDRFEKTLQDGLVKICSGRNLMSGMLESDDLEQKWNEYLQDYVSDAVVNFNRYPEAAIGFAGFLGMAVAHCWDENWDIYKRVSYKDYYGSRGFDDMDDHIVEDILKLDKDSAAKVIDTLKDCTLAAQGLIRHEFIEPQTADGFFVLVRCYTVLFRIGCSLELTRLGYKKQKLG